MKNKKKVLILLLIPIILISVIAIAILVKNDEINKLASVTETEKKADITGTTDSRFTYTVSSGCATIAKYIGLDAAVTIPSTIDGYAVQTIGGDAFKNCTIITSVVIPSEISSIEMGAFSYASNLVTVSIPSTVVNIGTNAFYRCDKLQNINVNSANESYSSQNGVVFNKNMTTLLIYPGGKGNSYTIPSTVTRIGAGAYCGCMSLTSLTIPSTITTIDILAFEDCTNLDTLVIPETVTTVGSGLLQGTENTIIYCKSNSQAYYYAITSSNISYEFTDKTITGISISTNPTKLTYIQNYETLDIAGGKLKVTYSDGTSSTITMVNSAVTISGFSNTTTGTKTITATHKGKTTTFDVTVVAKSPSSISVKTKPNKTSYVQNSETLDLTGGVLSVVYDDTSTGTIAMTDTAVRTSGFSNTTTGTKTITIGYNGKSTTFTVEVVAKSLSSISVTTKPTKTSYIQNYETLSLTGGVLTLTYNDNTTSTVDMTNSTVTTSGFSNTTTGTKTVTVNYSGKTTTFDVTVVAKSLSSISVKTKPTKTSYIQNYETLSLTGGVLTLTYNDTTTSTLDMTNSAVTTSGFNNTTTGTKTITVSYSGKTTSFTVTVVAKSVTGISITIMPTKTSYIQNYETLNLTGGVLTLVYNDNTTSTLSMTNSAVTTSGFSNSTTGTKTVTVSYSGKTTTYTVEVVAKSLTGITVTTNPTKTTYIQNYETLNLTGGVLTLAYNDNTTSTLSMTNSVVTTSGFSNTTTGTKTITVSYSSKTTTFDVTVVAKSLSNIVVSTMPTKTTYIQNYEMLDLTGGILTLRYNDNTSATVSMTNSAVTTSGFSNSTTGTKTVTVNYSSKTTTFTVAVVAKSLTGISVITNPIKTTYIQDYETLDLTGGIIKLNYNDDTSSQLSMTDSQVSVAGFGNSTTGTKTITVSYGGKTDTFTVEVVAKSLTGIAVTTMPTKTSYIQNYETLDLTGGKITVSYNDNTSTSLDMTNNAVTISGFSNTTVGTNTLTVTYSGKVTTFDVTIVGKSLTGITVTTMPTKTSYIQNYESLDLTGGAITLTYDDESTTLLDITDSLVAVTGFDNTVVGQNELTVTYSGKTITFNVTITAKALIAITINTNPTKATYIQNYETLDLTGGIITLIYNDETTSPLDMTDSSVTVTGFNNTVVGQNELTVTYSGKTKKFNVEIVAKSLTGIVVTTKPTKVNYIQNYETLDLTGGIITLTYDDTSTSPLDITDSSVTVTGFDNTNVGANTLTVSYNGKTTTFDMTIVEKSLIGIAVTTMPTKTSYIKGYETLDLTGGVITLTYDDTSTTPLDITDSTVTVTGFDNTNVGQNTLTVSYNGKTTTFDVTITAKAVIGIAVTAMPTKTSYIQNTENLNLSGGTIKITYNDNTNDTLDMTDSTVTTTGFDNTILGIKTVIINYSGKTATFDVEIIKNIGYTENQNGGITITVTQNPTETEVEIPEKIDGKDVTEIGDGAFTNRDDLISVKIPNSVVNISNNAFDTNTEVTIICDSGSKAEEFAKDNDMNYILADKTVESISIKAVPNKITYESNEQLDLTGGRILLTYTDGDQSPISMKFTGVTTTGFNSSTAGSQTITAAFAQKTTTFEITVAQTTVVENGDISEDGKTDATDLLLLKRHIIAGTKTSWILKDKKFTSADINGDGKVNATDLLLLKRLIVSK